VKSRPIAADHSSIMHNLSRLLAAALNMLVRQQPTVLQKPSNLLSELRAVQLDSSTEPDQIFLVTADVDSLYPSLNNHHRTLLLQQLPRLLQDQQGTVTLEQVQLPVHWLQQAIALVLDHHYVSFEQRLFRQRRGTAMGTPMAPPYANLILALLEQDVIKDFQEHLLLYRRYIDDILVVFRGDANALRQFQTRLAQQLQLTLTWSISTSNAEFLDLAIWKLHDGLCYRTHQKTLNNYLYVPRSSQHPPRMFRGIIIGELTRYARTCAREEDFLQIAKRFFQRLRARGYPMSILRQALQTIVKRTTSITGSWYELLNQPRPAPARNPKPTLDVYLSIPMVHAWTSGQASRVVQRLLLDYLQEIPNLRVRTSYTLEDSLVRRLVRARVQPVTDSR